MPIKFVYVDGSGDHKKELLLTKVCELAKRYYALPKIIIIEMRKLGKSMFGETVVDPLHKNVIKLNVDLNIRESIYVLTHELIHLSQITCGQLSVSRKSELVWNHSYKISKDKLSKLSYDEYQQLPWEVDVVKKQQVLLDILLKI